MPGSVLLSHGGEPRREVPAATSQLDERPRTDLRAEHNEDRIATPGTAGNSPHTPGRLPMPK